MLYSLFSVAVSCPCVCWRAAAYELQLLEIFSRQLAAAAVIDLLHGAHRSAEDDDVGEQLLLHHAVFGSTPAQLVTPAKRDATQRTGSPLPNLCTNV